MLGLFLQLNYRIANCVVARKLLKMHPNINKVALFTSQMQHPVDLGFDLLPLFAR